MQGDALVEGRFYGFRETRGADSPLRKVKLMSKVGRKGAIKVRFEDEPHRGLEEYVRTRQIVVLWAERQAFLRDEQRMQTLDEHALRWRDSAIEEAVGTILGSSGEPSAGAGRGVVAMPEEEIRRIMVRANMTGDPADLHPLAFRARSGEVYLPLEAGEAIARAFAAAEPQTVLMYIQDQEDELRVRGDIPGQRYLHDLCGPAYLPWRPSVPAACATPRRKLTPAQARPVERRVSRHGG